MNKIITSLIIFLLSYVVWGDSIKASVYNQNNISIPDNSIVQIMGSMDPIKNNITNLTDDIILSQVPVMNSHFYTTFYYEESQAQYMYYRYLLADDIYSTSKVCGISEIIPIENIAFGTVAVVFDGSKNTTEINEVNQLTWDLYWQLSFVDYINSIGPNLQFQWLSFNGFNSTVYFSTNLTTWTPLETYNGINGYLSYTITNETMGFFKVVQTRN